MEYTPDVKAENWLHLLRDTHFPQITKNIDG